MAVAIEKRPEGIILQQGQHNFDNPIFDGTLAPWYNSINPAADFDTFIYATDGSRGIARTDQSSGTEFAAMKYFIQNSFFGKGTYKFKLVINNKTNVADGGIVGITVVGSLDNQVTFETVSNNNGGFVTDAEISNTGTYQEVEFTITAYKNFPILGLYFYRSGAGLTQAINLDIDSINYDVVLEEECIDIEATINQDYGSTYATVNRDNHGLTTGDFVYIYSDVENYNGFWRIEVTNPNEFLLIDNPYVEWIVNASIKYCEGVGTHGWSCVHLPITYKVSNNRYPTNSIDTARTISTLTNSNGFAQFGLSGALGTFEDLSFVKISNAPNSDLNGVYQIIDKISTASVILNIEYNSINGASILGATIQLYYGNYNVVVQVYAGINASHNWALQKPYELAATLELIPDENNEVLFSINDILKAYVKTENNLLLGTMPNNIDMWTNFYISVAEQYDTSNGYSVTTFEGAFASDQSNFEGFAANCELPFKNIYSGHLGDFISAKSKWLTLFDEIIIFPDQYFDISIVANEEAVGYKSDNYLDGEPLGLYTVAFDTDPGKGVLRFKPFFDPLADTVKVWLYGSTNNFDLSTGSNFGSGIAWTIDSEPNASGLGVGDNTQYLRYAFSGSANNTYTIRYSVRCGAADDQLQFTAYMMTTLAGYIVGSTSTVVAGDSSTLITVTITPLQDIDFVAIQVYESGGTPPHEAILESLTVVHGASSEEITIKISDECYEQSIDLQWLNNLGGFDQWRFTAQSEHAIDITGAIETKKNRFPNWPKSWGANADTVRKQVSRTSMIKKFIVSQNLTQNQADAISYIKSSPLVQIVNSRQDRRTVIVDTDSFVKYTDGDKLFTISFNITYTDDIPSQKV